MDAGPEPDLCGPFDPLDERVVLRAAAAAGDTPAQARSRLAAELSDPGAGLRAALAARRLPPHVWSEGLEAYYASDPAAVYDTLLWNATWVKRALRARVAAFLPAAPARLLCHGDGLGIDSLAWSRLGHRPLWCDASAPCRRFAEALHRDAGAAVEYARDLQAVPEGSVDAVLSLDVLEHCPDPAAEVASAARRLRAGGLFIVNAPFPLVGPRHPTHLDANRRFSGAWRELYVANGLSPVTGSPLWDPLVLRKDGASARAGWGPRLWPARLGAPLLALARLSSAPFAAGEACYTAAAKAVGVVP